MPLYAVTRTRRWMSLLTKLLKVCWPLRDQLMLALLPSLASGMRLLGIGSALVAYFLALAGYAASAVGAPWRNGSYTSPLIHSRCNSTANFRATATAARFFAFFPPLSHSRSPYRRKSVSGPNGPRI